MYNIKHRTTLGENDRKIISKTCAFDKCPPNSRPLPQDKPADKRGIGTPACLPPFRALTHNVAN